MENSAAMKAGDGPDSYFQTSKWLGTALDQTKTILIDGIVDLLELPKDLGVFSIADLGCSVGPNSFSCVDTIIEAVKCKPGTDVLALPEVFVFYNDRVENDFNTLFRALPGERQYMAAGVPGSFHGRLFPKASINVMTSFTSLHWLSKVPEGVTNKGRITYSRSSSQVAEAFRAQFFRDMKDFLNARSEELIPGGILALLIPSRPQGTPPSESNSAQFAEFLADVLADMGTITEDVVDSFNIPFFFPTASEVKEIVVSSNSQHFSIEKVEGIQVPIFLRTYDEIIVACSHTRAILEGVFCQHFGPDITDQLFTRFPKNVQNHVKSQDFPQVAIWESTFLLLKRINAPPAPS